MILESGMHGPVPPRATTPVSTLSLRSCLTIATIFWLYVSLTSMARWELMRQAANGQGVAPPDLIALACVFMFPVLWVLTVLSWLAGYDLTRWPRILAVNLVLAFILGLFARPVLFLSVSILRDMTIPEAMAAMDSRDPARQVYFWGSSVIEDAAQYLVLQGILTGAAFYVRLKAEQALRQRIKSDYDRARLQALRMQTNPHFLFNTLSAIAGLIRTRPEGAESMVTQLGELLRATLVDRNAEFVPLRRELDLGAQYLEIQRARFDSRFDYRIHAPHEVTKALVPPLLLQPLLENAAEYGLSSREGTIEVDVHCSLVGDRVHIIVSNHAKMPVTGPGAVQRGFGLDNVRERLRAAFGETAGFAAEYTSTGLFEARLEFPVRLGERTVPDGYTDEHVSQHTESEHEPADTELADAEPAESDADPYSHRR